MSNSDTTPPATPATTRIRITTSTSTTTTSSPSATRPKTATATTSSDGANSSGMNNHRPRMTRSLSGANVNSVYMKVNVSPSKSSSSKIYITPHTSPISDEHNKLSFQDEPSSVGSQNSSGNQFSNVNREDGDEEWNRMRIETKDDICRYLLAMKEEIRELKQQVASQNEEISQLRGEICLASSKMLMKDHVIVTLRKELVKTQQYQRRYSVVIHGLEKERNESKDSLRDELEKIVQEVDAPNVSMDAVDKFHRNGPQKGSEQELIVRFKSHSAKESFYKARKNLQRQNIKIRPSLSKARKDLLNQGVQYLKESEMSFVGLPNKPHFVMADVHGNIQLKMRQQWKNQLFFTVESLDDIAETIHKVNVTDEHQTYYGDHFSEFEL